MQWEVVKRQQHSGMAIQERQLDYHKILFGSLAAGCDNDGVGDARQCGAVRRSMRKQHRNTPPSHTRLTTYRPGLDACATPHLSGEPADLRAPLGNAACRPSSRGPSGQGRLARFSRSSRHRPELVGRLSRPGLGNDPARSALDAWMMERNYAGATPYLESSEHPEPDIPDRFMTISCPGSNVFAAENLGLSRARRADAD